jgi:putative DNA primase/helicase
MLDSNDTTATNAATATEPDPSQDREAQARRDAMAKALERVPAELREPLQWVDFKLEPSQKQTKLTKIPYNARTGRKASSTNPKTWATYKAALDAYGRGGYDGLGFVFSPEDPYTGVDLDNCRDPETGAIEPKAQAIIDRLAGYTEVSPSGKGVHIIVKAKLPPGRKRRDVEWRPGVPGVIEMYDHARFFTMTGQRLEKAL